jgi:hypothetical protein
MKCLDDRAVAAVLLMRTAVPVAAHPGEDHVRDEFTHGVVGQPPPLHHPRGEVLGDDAAAPDQLAGEGAALGLAHVDRHAELAPAVVVEQPALVGVRVGVLLAVGADDALVDRQLAGGVEPVAVLDLDDLGAVVGEHPGGDRTDPHPAEVGHADAGQRAGPRAWPPADVVVDLHCGGPSSRCDPGRR